MANYRYPRIAMEGYVHGHHSKGRPKMIKKDIGIAHRWSKRRPYTTEFDHTKSRMYRSRVKTKDHGPGLVKKLPLRVTASPGH